MSDRAKSAVMKGALTAALTMVLMCLALVFSFGSTEAFADSTDDVATTGITVDIVLDVTRDYTKAYNLLDSINEIRAENEVSDYVMDSDLMEDAMQRAAEILVYNGSTRLDGSMSTHVYSIGALGTLVSTSYVANLWKQSSAVTHKYNKVGIGYVQCGSYYACVILVDSGTATEPEDVPTTKVSMEQTLTVDTGYLADIESSYSSENKLYVGISKTVPVIKVNNLNSDYIAVSLSKSCLTWTTTDADVLSIDANNQLQPNSVGTATITVYLKSDPSIYCTTEFTVRPLDLSSSSSASIDDIEDQYYTGEAIEPSIVVRYGDTVLTSGYDYTVSYSNNISVGTATVTVTGFGNYTGTITGTFEILEVSTETPLTFAFAASSKCLKQVGERLRISTYSNYGTLPYTVVYYVMYPGDSEWTELYTGTFESYGTYYDYYPTVAGETSFKAVLTDSTGWSGTKTISLTIETADLVNESTISSTSITQGDSITITGAASGGTEPYYYAMYVKHSTATSYTLIRSSSAEETMTWTPSLTGTYAVLIRVKDSNGTMVDKSYTLTVNEAATDLTNKSTISATSITKGTALTLTGAASGGTSPYYYSFIAKLSTSSSFTTLRDYSTSTTKTWTPSSAGTYTVRIKVKDATGTIVSKTFTVTVSSAELTNNSTISATSITKGTALTLTGAASGGTSPYYYSFIAKLSTSSSFTTLRDYSTSTTKTWTPSSTGTYTVRIKVKDATGTIVSKTFTVKVSSAELTNNSTISATSMTKGTSLTLTGAASGGTSPYYYSFIAKLSTSSSFTTLRDYSTSTTKTWTPSSTGTYIVRIKVKDATGTIVSKTFTVTVSGATELTNNSTISTTIITKGTTITLTGAASGGTSPYYYSFIAKLSTSSDFTTLRDYSTTATKTWTPSSTGTYIVRIKVKDATGTIVSKTFTVTVK